jgi:hypothetical protein
MKLRNLILCSILAAVGSLAGTVVAASARTARHKHHRVVRHHRFVRHHRVVRHYKRRHSGPAAEPSALPRIGGAQPSPSLFGINTLGYTRDSANFNQEMPTARNMGARWVHFTNDSVKFASNGQPIWRTLDSEVTTARRLGLGVLVSLGGTPRACSGSPRPSDFTGCPPTTSGDLYAYSLFLRAELVRYHNDVQYWESWLEPNNNAWWRPAANPQQYANLLRTQYAVFQSVNRQYHTHLELLFGGPISFSTMPQDGWAVLPFVHAVLTDLHGARAFDAIALHAYRFPSNNTAPADLNWGPTALEYDYVAGLRYPAQGCSVVYSGFCQMTWSEELSAYEQEFANDGYSNMPLWLTEFGWPGNANPTDALYPSFDTQAAYLSQAYGELLGLPFVQAAFVFNLEDYQPGVASSDPAFFYHYGLLQYGFASKPAAAVYEQFVQQNPGR